MTMGDEMGATSGSGDGDGAPAREQGAALMRMGRMAEAGRALQQAVTENPADEQSWRLLGGALSAGGDAAGAAGAFEQAARLAPDSPKNHYNLALALQATGQIYAARTHLDHALALDPDYEQARTLRDDLARQGETRGSGMPAPTPSSSSSDVPSAAPAAAAAAPRYTPASSAASDDLAPVGGAGNYASPPTAGGETSVPRGPSPFGAPPPPPPPAPPGAGAGAGAGAPVLHSPAPGASSTAETYAPTPVLGQAYGYAAANTSGMRSDVPAEIQGGWNWGAFGLSFLWLINHRLVGWAIGVFVLQFIPFVSLVLLPISIYLGVVGNRLGWQNRQFNSVEDFKACQRIWTYWAIPLFILGALIGVAAVVFPVFAQARRAAVGGG